MSQERTQILKMLQAGEISTEQAMELLDALDEELHDDTGTQVPPADVPNLSGWWVYPTAAGAVVMSLGAPLVALGLIRRVGAFWAVCCGWLPLLTGLLVLALGVWSRGARWFHLRIQNSRTGRQKFAMSLPLPLSLTARLVRIARPYVPQLADTGVDEAILALQDSMDKETGRPLSIDVQGDEDGEQILIWFG